MNNLQSEFDNDDINHFTYYDYLLQCNENGQLRSFISTIQTIELTGLIGLLRRNQNEFKERFMDALHKEILIRVEGV
jgi:hypothetical protein